MAQLASLAQKISQINKQGGGQGHSHLQVVQGEDMLPSLVVIGRIQLLKGHQTEELVPPKKSEVKLPIGYRIKLDAIKLKYMYLLSVPWKQSLTQGKPIPCAADL